MFLKVAHWRGEAARSDVTLCELSHSNEEHGLITLYCAEEPRDKGFVKFIDCITASSVILST